jgi:hypothetical protein
MNADAPGGDEGALQGVLGESASRRIRVAMAKSRLLVRTTSIPNASRSPHIARSTTSRIPSLGLRRRTPALVSMSVRTPGNVEGQAD